MASPEAAPPPAVRNASPLLLPAASRNAHGRPRFHFVLDSKLAAGDHGLRFLVAHETRHDGFERATRDVIDAHLAPGDLFIDVGAHVGAMSMTAATRHGDNPVLAIEPSPENLRQLRMTVAANGMANNVTVVPAAIGRKTGRGRLQLVGGSMGHHLSASPDAAALDVAVTTIDDLLDRFPQHAGRRVAMKIDVEGHEPDVIAGAARLLASGRLRLLIWEKGGAMTTGMEAMAATLTRLGFSMFMFALHDWGGPLIPFVASPNMCNVFCLAPGEQRKASYPRDFARRPPYSPRLGPPPAPSKLVAYIEAMMAARGSDGSRWTNWQALAPGAVERADAAAAHLSGAGSILDLGAGRMELKGRLAPGVRYRPADLVPWAPDCIVVDLNRDDLDPRPFPAGRYDALAALAVLEYLHDPAAILTAARNAAPRLIATYPPLDRRLPLAARRGFGWVNDFDLPQFEALLASAGWRILLRGPVQDSLLWVCEAKLA